MEFDTGYKNIYKYTEFAMNSNYFDFSELKGILSRNESKIENHQKDKEEGKTKKVEIFFFSNLDGFNSITN